MLYHKLFTSLPPGHAPLSYAWFWIFSFIFIISLLSGTSESFLVNNSLEGRWYSKLSSKETSQMQLWVPSTLCMGVSLLLSLHNIFIWKKSLWDFQSIPPFSVPVLSQKPKETLCKSCNPLIMASRPPYLPRRKLER